MPFEKQNLFNLQFHKHNIQYSTRRHTAYVYQVSIFEIEFSFSSFNRFVKHDLFSRIPQIVDAAAAL
jgi:hypothetical protein